MNTERVREVLYSLSRCYAGHVLRACREVCQPVKSSTPAACERAREYARVCFAAELEE